MTSKEVIENLRFALKEMVVAYHGWPPNPKDESDRVCRHALEEAITALSSAPDPLAELAEECAEAEE